MTTSTPIAPEILPLTPERVAALVRAFGPEILDTKTGSKKDTLTRMRVIHLVGHALNVLPPRATYFDICQLLRAWAKPGGPAYRLPVSPPAITRAKDDVDKYLTARYGKTVRICNLPPGERSNGGFSPDGHDFWTTLQAILG